MMFGCYRKDEANDPEMYVAAVSAVMAEFAPEVIEYVTDPRTGLPRTAKWPPSVAEVVEACEARAKHLDCSKTLKARGYRFDGTRWVKQEESAE